MLKGGRSEAKRHIGVFGPKHQREAVELSITAEMRRVLE
jgi:hypothetical protein